MHLLTWHGTVICLPDSHGAITHQVLPLAIDTPPAMDFEPLAPRTQVRHSKLGFIHVEPAVHPGGLHLSRDGHYICANPDESRLAFDRAQASGWETFLPITHAAFEDLQHILRHRWIVRATRRVIRRKLIAVTDGFVLRIGEHGIGLGDQFAACIAGRSPAGLPDRLVLADEELVLAEPRHSALIQTAIWPVRSRRVAEIMTLAAHRHIIGLEPSQDVLERDTEFLLANKGAAGLSDLLEDLDTYLEDLQATAAEPAQSEWASAGGADADPERDKVLMGWAQREMAPWLLKPVDAQRLERVFNELNSTPWFGLYIFADGGVTVKPKPDAVEQSELFLWRVQQYLDLFTVVCPLLPSGFSASVCVGINDMVNEDFGVPLFAFQKKSRDTTILLPDVDIVSGKLLASPENQDHFTYDAKRVAAVFAGSTTGGIITPEVARNFATPRLRAARAFAGHPQVDFRLPGIAQTTSEEAEDILRGYAFCQRPRLSWQQQLRNRFLISIDGNGATCARVAVALQSNSVLLKYNSPQNLFYFGGLQPWLHYIPIASDWEVERVIELETLQPGSFRDIPERASRFARTYLNLQGIVRYTAMLLQLYGRALAATSEVASRPEGRYIGRSAAAAAGTTVIAHIENLGDTTSDMDDWVGDAGSNMAIEGFAIFLSQDLPTEGFSYQTVLEDGTLSAPAVNEEYCGTRGELQPIYGMRISIEGRFAEAFEVTYAASFVDGSECGPVAAGEICKAEMAVPMEAFRITILPRNLPG